MAKKTFYITTPIYYTSGNLHIGHAYTSTICDTIARYKKMKDYDVFYLTGTDEHGEKVQQKAAQAGVTPLQYVDSLVAKIKDLWELLEIDYDKFIRTTDQYHEEAVQKIFSYLLNKGDIYLGSYEGWYCVPCEAFYTQGQLDENHCCPDCGRKVEKRQEESYFFKMSNYSERLIKYYEEHPGFIEPISRQNEMMNNFLKPGLNDLCVSRTSFDWGVKVKENPKHVVYVWLDALTNYINALGYGSNNSDLFNKYWHNDENHEVLHVIGKEIVRFHVIYWPIFLMALDLPLPSKIYAHGWIVMKDGKMSKSKGNIIAPEPLIQRYGLDVLRFFLVYGIPFGSDGLFTPELFIETINTNLVNDFGNLLNRTIGMVGKYFGGDLPLYLGNITEHDEAFRIFGEACIADYFDKMDQFKITEAIQSVIAYISRANKYIESTTPWILAKDENKRNELGSVMVHLVACLRQSAIMLSPVLLNSPKKLFAQLSVLPIHQTFESLLDFGCVGGNNIIKGEMLFPRLDSEIEIPYLVEAMN